MKKEQPKTDNVTANEIKIDGTLYWEGIHEIYGKLSQGILMQNALVLELSNKFKDVIESDRDLILAVNGLGNSISDIAKNARTIIDNHNKSNNPTKGKVVGDDDVIYYLGVGSELIAVEEALASIMSTAYLDVFATLSSKVPAELKDSLDDATKEIGDAKKNFDKEVGKK